MLSNHQEKHLTISHQVKLHHTSHSRTTWSCTSNVLQMWFKCASNVLVFIEWDNIHFITYLCVFALYACMFGNITDNPAMKIASILCSFVKEKAEYCVVYLGSSVSLIALQSHASRLSMHCVSLQFFWGPFPAQVSLSLFFLQKWSIRCISFSFNALC